MIEIKVLGPGCANCKRLEQIAHKVVDTLAVDAKIEKSPITRRLLNWASCQLPV